MDIVKKINRTINPKNTLFRWGPLDIYLVYISAFVETILVKVTEHYPWPWAPNLSCFKDGRVTWINDMQDLALGGLKYFKKYFLNLKNYRHHWQRWENLIKEYKRKSLIWDKTKFSQLSDNDLYKLLKDFYDFTTKFWLIAHMPEVANWGGEYLLKKELNKRFPEGKVNEYLEILSAPVRFSFYQQEEMDLLKVGLIRNATGRKQTLMRHKQKYFWLLNSYGGNQILTEKYFSDKLKKLCREKSAQQRIKDIKKGVRDQKLRKINLARRLHLDKKMILIADQLAQSIWWQDLRKGYIWQLNAWTDKFVNEIARRRHWAISDLRWCWLYELLEVLKNKNFDKKKIILRKKYHTVFTKEGHLIEISDQKIAKKIYYQYVEPKIDKEKISQLSGLVVSRGHGNKIIGPVKIVRNPFTDGKKMKNGSILVASMTSPEFIVVMRKARAVITDEGGMTSHAAIVTRELKLPCIVGTKIATKILKDGDMVEVDANKGVVKILK